MPLEVDEDELEDDEQEEEVEEEEERSDGKSDIDNDQDTEEDGEDDSQDNGDDEDDDDNDSPSSRDPVRDELRQISFGALLDAQHSLPIPSVPQIRRHGDKSSDPSAKVNLLRERLAELKALKKTGDSSSAKTTTKDSSKHTSTDTQRAHKHAPMEQSSKYQVSRKRAALLTSSNPYHARDPRFSAVTGTVNDETVRRNYAFLADYGASELNDLKAALKTTKGAEERERLKREIMVRESKARAEADKERARKVVAAHRKEEKAAVAQGKQPFFLKGGEVKKRVLVDKFESMKGKERERAMTRRKKKESQREKRNMPNDRRGV